MQNASFKDTCRAKDPHKCPVTSLYKSASLVDYCILANFTFDSQTITTGNDKIFLVMKNNLKILQYQDVIKT